MQLLERYELILQQALDELGHIAVPTTDEEAFDQQAELAPALGDILYRLTIEHGVPFTEFRDTVIRLISAEPSEKLEGASSEPEQDAFARALEPRHGLILLALEVMPPDPPY